MTKPIDPPYFDPITLLAEWRQLATQYDGTEEGERFLRLISSLEQDHSKPDVVPLRMRKRKR